jgi:hypothetical protein
VLYPDDRDLHLGWGAADGTNDKPDLRAFAIAGHVFIVRL